MPDYLPASDAEYALWLGNFITVANANLAALGLVAADITALQALKTDLDAKLAADVAAQEAARASAAARKTSRKNSEVTVRNQSRRISVNANIPSNLKEALGLNVRDAVRTFADPVPPVSLVANANANGVNLLKWGAGGNGRGTTYVIEAKVGSGAWAQVGVATAARFEHTGQTPGARVAYRVRAAKRGLVSAPSNDAVVYEG